MEQELVVIGVDPGSAGAFGIVNLDGKILEMVRIPYYQFQTGSGKRSRIDCSAVVSLLSDWCMKYDVLGLACEGLAPVATFNCHTNYGFGASMTAFEMVCACMQIPFETVRSTEWQKFQFPQKGKHDKERSRQLVRTKHPYVADQLNRKMDNDLAEAALIADYAVKRGLFKQAR